MKINLILLYSVLLGSEELIIEGQNNRNGLCQPTPSQTNKTLQTLMNIRDLKREIEEGENFNLIPDAEPQPDNFSKVLNAVMPIAGMVFGGTPTTPAPESCPYCRPNSFGEIPVTESPTTETTDTAPLSTEPVSTPRMVLKRKSTKKTNVSQAL